MWLSLAGDSEYNYCTESEPASKAAAASPCALPIEDTSKVTAGVEITDACHSSTPRLLLTTLLASPLVSQLSIALQVFELRKSELLTYLLSYLPKVLTQLLNCQAVALVSARTENIIVAWHGDDPNCRRRRPAQA